MNCPEHDELQDLVDETLPAEERMRLRAHVASCAACRAEVEALESLIASARDLAIEEVPRRDLWPAIEAEIRREARPERRLSRIGLAAAAMLVAAVTFTMVGRQEPQAPQSVGESMAVHAEPMDELRIAGERVRSEGGQMHVKVDLLRTLEVRRAQLDPATRELVDRNMEIIDRAVA
ncbi:MAG: zf-HC2 domain-containing protein, partial [Thermoanaerobaculia bacterium]|nr:zf-HC2 domain-containing protein [Thermoanaerobaculia bacterium]